MAAKKVYTAKQAGQPFDLYLRGELIRVEAGMYVVTEQNGSVELVDEETFNSDYAQSDSQVAGEFHKGSAKKKSGKSKAAAKAETEAEPDPTDENVVHVAVVPEDVVDEVVGSPGEEFRADAELPDDTMFDKEVSDRKVAYGSEGVPADAEGMPPVPTEPAEPRDPRPEGDEPTKQGDI
jgi:hypothetical protein